MNKVLPKKMIDLTVMDWPSLIEASLAGDVKALEKLLLPLQQYIYNVAIRMVTAPDDAEDVTQEVLLKIVLNLSRFDESKAKFTTWCYAILRNHVYNMKPKKLEAVTGSFEEYGNALSQVPDIDYETKRPEERLLVKEANIGCMLGMLLCLEREQRFIFILGEIIGVDSATGGEICELTPENFRQKLSRARKDLYNFLQDKCGLLNKNNPCRCHKKTQGFIKAGWVDPGRIKFADHFYENEAAFSEENASVLSDLNAAYAGLFQNLPLYDSDRPLLQLEELIKNKDFRRTFRLDD